MQETIPVPPPAELAPTPPVTEVTSQPEVGEKPKLIRVLQRSFARLEQAFDRKRTEGTLSEEDRIGFVSTNIEYQLSNGGEKISVQSFKDPDGARRSIRRNVPLNFILKQLDEDITAATDEKEKQALQADKDYLMENSRPLLRNDNRRELEEKIIERRATLLARAITGSDADASQFREQAKEAIETERELVVPNPRSRIAAEDALVPVQTVEDIVQKADVLLPTADSPLNRPATPGRFGRFTRSPIAEARKNIRQNNELLETQRQLDQAAQRMEAERRAAIVHGALSDTRDVLLSNNSALQERIAAMRKQTARMNAAVDKVLGTTTQDASMTPTTPSLPTVEPVVTGEGEDGALSQLDVLDPLSLGDRAGEHPEEFVVETADETAEETSQSGESTTTKEQVADNKEHLLPQTPLVISAEGETEKTEETAGVTPLEAASLVLTQHHPNSAENTPTPEEAVNTEAYRAIHNAGNEEVTPVTSPEPTQIPVTPPPHKSFFSKLADALGLKAA